MSTQRDVGSGARVADRFALGAGCIVSLLAVWYASDLIRESPPRFDRLLISGAMFLLGLSLVADAYGNRLRWPLRWSAMVLMIVDLVWFRS